MGSNLKGLANLEQTLMLAIGKQAADDMEMLGRNIKADTPVADGAMRDSIELDVKKQNRAGFDMRIVVQTRYAEIQELDKDFKPHGPTKPTWVHHATGGPKRAFKHPGGGKRKFVKSNFDKAVPGIVGNAKKTVSRTLTQMHINRWGSRF